MNITSLDTSVKLSKPVYFKKNEDSFGLGAATRETTSSDDGERIGLFSVGDTVYIATYADNSTSENPIVKVGDYEVEVNKVNPENATELEMCALLSHLDKTNPDMNHGMSSFSKMRTAAEIGQLNGFFDGIGDVKLAYTKKQDWKKIIEKMKMFFAENPATYKQAVDCENLLFAFTKAK